MSIQLVFATHNRNKVREVQRLIDPAIQFKSLKDIGCEEDIPETSNTIEGNALQKARYVYEKYGENCFAEDTGLEIEALDGAPGVYTARYAGEDKNDEANIRLVLQELKGEDNRRARFKTVFALIIDGKEYLFEGLAPGQITQEKRGEGGFGYDPIFQPDGYEQTFAELGLEIKNKISHRALAFEQLKAFLLRFEY
jgi:XTP/dITP diphosphohydrolase